MSKLDKNALALTFKFDCDRFLKLRLLNANQRPPEARTNRERPIVRLIALAGRRWEVDKYEDLIFTAQPQNVVYEKEKEIDPEIDRKPFKKVDNLFEILRKPAPPQAIIEAEFVVPDDITSGLKEAYDKYGLERVRARPDILWIRPYPTGVNLINVKGKSPQYEIHVIDVKMAAEPSLKHFTEVTFYALALSKAIELEGLADKYAVSGRGLIWPGSHDINEFRNKFRDFTAQGEGDPLTATLLNTLKPVPYEVYLVHVRQFFEERLLRVLAQELGETAWHFGPKCQTCEFVGFCRDEAEKTDHLSKVPFLNEGQAELFRQNGIRTTTELAVALATNSPAWQAVKASSQQLSAESLAIAARAEALTTSQPKIIEGRKSALMPRYSDMNIFLTLHFDPGSGITFAMGAKRIFFKPNQAKGTRPITEEQAFIVDRVNNFNPSTEKNRLIEMAQLVRNWLLEAIEFNEHLAIERRTRGEVDSEFGKIKVHIFFWSEFELIQLRHMFERHLIDPQVVSEIEHLVRMFPPENVLPDPEVFKSFPGTIVKQVMRHLVGLPVAFDYTLLEVVNSFFPDALSDGRYYSYQLPFGFQTPLNDQIPFERAYELWEDRVFLTHYNSTRKYTRDEIYSEMKKAILVRLDALAKVVSKLREHCGAQLVLPKSPISALNVNQVDVPTRGRHLIAFEKLDVVSTILENRQKRLLPVEEREARFISIRGLELVKEGIHPDTIKKLLNIRPQYKARQMIPFTFADSSRDARIKEGDFLLALSNEDNPVDLDAPWRLQCGLNKSEAVKLLVDNGFQEDKWRLNPQLPLYRLLQVEVALLETVQDPPLLVITPADELLFEFAIKIGIVDLSQPMVLDPLQQDFTTKRVEKVLRRIGGNPSS